MSPPDIAGQGEPGQQSFLAGVLSEKEISVAAFARKLQESSDEAPDYSTVARWVRGAVIPRRRNSDLIADVLGLDREQVRRSMLETVSQASEESIHSGGSQPSSDTVRDELEAVLMELTRRDLLELGGLGALDAIWDLVDKGDAGLEMLGRSTEMLGRKFNEMELRDLDFLLDHQLSLLQTMLTKPLRVQERLHLSHFGGRLAVLKGTCAFLQGETRVSRKADHVALRLAREAGDLEIVQLLRNELASTLLYENRPAEALKVVQTPTPIHSPAQNANSDTSRALAYASLGDFSEARKAIRSAESEMEFLRLGDDSSGGGPQWSFSALSGHTRNAEAWLMMGAETEAAESLGMVPEIARRLRVESPRWILHAQVLESQIVCRSGDAEAALSSLRSVLASQPKDIGLVGKRAAGVLAEIAAIPKFREEAQWLRGRFSGDVA